LRLNRKQKEAGEILAGDSKYVMFWGGSRSGKTWVICRFIIIRAFKYPGSKHLIVRFAFSNAKKTVWMQTLLPELRQSEIDGFCKISHHEGIVKFTNGSIIMLAGLEPSRIDAVLGGEYATIFVTEANENKYQDIESLFSRLNDNSTNDNGDMIPLKFICDLNPTTTNSWPNILFLRGLDPITMKPKDNFSEFDNLHFKPEDNAENLSEGYIETLKNLSPGKRRRFYEGEFGSYEGLVFNVFDESTHVVDDFEIDKNWPRIRSIDFGYTHPFVCLWSAYDEANETVYFYKEWVQRGLTVSVHSEYIKEMSAGETIADTVADHDAEDRATLDENGIRTIKAVKDVLPGIDRVLDILDYNKRVTLHPKDTFGKCGPQNQNILPTCLPRNSCSTNLIKKN